MIFRLAKDNFDFPDISLAEEDGLLAVGGDLRSERLLKAYANGVFPWYEESTPILWYSPHERFVIHPDKIRISKSMRSILRKEVFQFTVNRAFDQVIQECATQVRKGQDGTWIVNNMLLAYNRLHALGHAHSIEVWQDQKLVGGLYGVLVGAVFCGESMFSIKPNSSKAALIFLAKQFDLSLIDCQLHTEHLESMGAKMIPQKVFIDLLSKQIITAHGLQKLLRHTK